MKKKTAYIGLILSVAAFAAVILVVNQETGYIKTEAPGFETDLNLRSRRTSLWGRKSISLSGSEPAEIRAGSYMPERIVLRQTEDSDRWYSLISRGNSWGKLATIDIAKGQTTMLKLGPPFVIRTDVQQKSQAATISVSLIGQAGEKWNPQVLTANGPQAARLKIVDEAGNILAAGRCQYG